MNTSTGEGPRYASTTRGGIIIVSLYSWTCIAMGMTFARFIIASLHKLEFGYDDGAVLAGTMVYLGGTASWQFAVNAGLGKHVGELHPGDAERCLKVLYAAQMLGVTSTAFSKLSTVFLIDRVVTETQRRKLFLLGIVCFWFVYSIFAFGFQCVSTRPWEIDPQKCFKGGPLISAIALGILIDIILAVWILPILLPLTMSRKKIIPVAVLFGARLLVPLLASGQAWSVAKMMRSSDPTWDGFQIALFFQAVSSLSLIVAHLPRIRRFLDVRGSGLLATPRITEAELMHFNGSTFDTELFSNQEHQLKRVQINSTKFITTTEPRNNQKTEDGLLERNNG